jgi:GT2 family glycosyltransferase
MTIYVVLPVHNRWHFTEQFLKSLGEQIDLPVDTVVHTLVVDDGSTDATRQELTDRPHTTVLAGDGSLWWAGAVARAFAHLSHIIQSGDWIYLGNNDTVLAPAHLQALLETAQENPKSLIGSVSYEIWPTGERHPVSTGFRIDVEHLMVSNIPGTIEIPTSADALAGRGLLMPAEAVWSSHLRPRVLPQHFADIAFTSDLRRRGFGLIVEPRALSTQLERAGSSVEFAPRIIDMVSPRSQLYLPAVWSFWWHESTTRQRASLPLRFVGRGIKQVLSRNYVFRDSTSA